MAKTNPGPDALSDLLALASEAGAERLVETDRLLRELVGPDAVNEAHLLWTGRLREGLLRDTPARAPAERSGTRAGPSDAAFHLVRRLPDPSRAGRAGRAGP